MKKTITLLLVLFYFNSNAQVLESYPSTQTLAIPSNYINFNNKLYYFARDPSYNYSLYATDGTATGNQQIKSFGFTFGANLTEENQFKEFKIIFNNKLYFVYSNSLYTSDGTAAGTVILTSTIYNTKWFEIYNNKLYFTAQTADSGLELWSTDGTVSGTTLVKDIFVGTSSAFNPTYDPHFTVFNNKLFFVANDGVVGYELWSTDGTTSGTALFKDIRTNEGGSTSGFGSFLGTIYYNYPLFTVVNNKMYFGTNPYTNAAMGNYMVTDSPILYETDGTALNTKVVEPPLADPNTCSCGNNNYNYIYNLKGLTAYNNKLFVFGNQAFHSFGGITNGGIYLVDNINPISRLQAFGDFEGDSGTSDDVKRFSMRLFNSELYFLGSTYESGSPINLWKMNPNSYEFTNITQTPNNTQTEFASSGISLRLLVAKEFNNKLFFVKDRETAGKIFSTDGTISGTQFEARGIASNQNNTQQSTQAMTVVPISLGVFNNAIYFRAQFASGPNGLWRINFTNLSNSTFENNKISLFPNPTSSNLNLKLTNILENGNLKIISITGQTIFKQQNLSGTNFNFDVSNLSQGIYTVQLSNGNEIFNSKFIKK